MRRIALIACASLAGCDSPLAVEREEGPLLQTDALEYVLVRTPSGFETTIRYTFTNATGGPVHLGNCLGDVTPELERLEGERWVIGWSAVYLLCLSPPVVIEAGAEYRDSVRLFAGPHGSDRHPQFTTPDPEGVYRLFWFQASDGPRDGGPGGGLLAEDRYSNRFVIREP